MPDLGSYIDYRGSILSCHYKYEQAFCKQQAMNQRLFRQVSIRKNLELRAAIIQAVRTFFLNEGYLEVETPCRIPAPIPEANIDAELSGSWFLHTSPELYMKWLLAAGYSRIFQVCRCFRQKERGKRHLPEFTILEWYCVESNYLQMMDQSEELLRFVASRIGLKDLITYQGEKIDLKKPWERITVAEAFDKFAPISMKDALLNNSFEEIMALEIEPLLARERPLFLYDYPARDSALTRLKPGSTQIAERFELYIAGIELCNASSELTDHNEQKKRFKIERKRRSQLGKEIYPTPDKFLENLKFMPNASGNALGIDRLVMLFADTTKIDDVTAFTPEEL